MFDTRETRMPQTQTLCTLCTTRCLIAVCAFALLFQSTSSSFAQIPVPAGVQDVSLTHSPATQPFPELSPTPHLESANSFREIAKQMVAEAEALAKKGDLNAARRLALRAKAIPVAWPVHARTPEMLLNELGDVAGHTKQDLHGLAQPETGRFRNLLRPNSGAEVGTWLSAAPGSVTSADLNVPEGHDEPSDVVFPDGAHPVTPRLVPGSKSKQSHVPEIAPLPPFEPGSEASSTSRPLVMHKGRELSNGAHTSIIQETQTNAQIRNPLRSPWKNALFYGLSALLGLLMGFAAMLYLLPAVLTQYASKFAPVFRVEVVNGQSLPSSTVFQIGETDLEQVSRRGEAKQKASQDHVVELGQSDIPLHLNELSYEEARQERERNTEKQQESILKHIFEQNLEMRNQLNGLDDQAA